MKQKSGPEKAPAEQVLKTIRRQTRRQYSAEEKIRIVLEGLRGEENISERCRRQGIGGRLPTYRLEQRLAEAGTIFAPPCVAHGIRQRRGSSDKGRPSCAQ